MAAPRLPFLWPMLFKGSERAAIETSPTVRRRLLHATTRRRQDVVQQRYGSANEPPPHLGQEQRTAIKTESSKNTAANVKKSDIVVTAKDTESTPKKSTAKVTTDPMLNGGEEIQQDTPATEKPVESLLDTVPDPARPTAESSGTSMITYEEHLPPVHAPHMDTPRHVHHFDTFGLVKRLEDSGWKNEQAITLMKSVRLMLSDNMDLAREALVSRSQVENETYLFKAACSELKTEVSARRKTEQDKMRTERTHLQHELDILNQQLGQNVATLKDDLKGMFDDRKMLVRNEQRDMERKVAELNYKITVSLQADSKSDVEALRWIMTRRVIITLAVIVVMVLSSLKLFSNAMHEKELEQKRKSRMRNQGTQMDSDSMTSSSAVASEMLVKEGDNPAYVSLG